MTAVRYTMFNQRTASPALVLSVAVNVCLASYLYWVVSSSSLPSILVHPWKSERDSSPRDDDITIGQPEQQSENKDDLLFDRRFPGEEKVTEIPGSIPTILHYLWCGDKKFRFRDYLGVLSAVKVFRPISVMFHFTHEPGTDDYNTWFKDVKSSLPGLELQKLSSNATCGSLDMLKTVLGFLSNSGGLFVGEGIILSPALKGQSLNTDLWFAFSDTSDKTSGVIIAKKGFSNKQKETYFKSINTARRAKPGCPSVDKFALSPHDQFCVAVPGTVFPRDIMYAKTSFAQVARLYFYGRRGPMTPEQDPNNLIPRISHFLRFKTTHNLYGEDFPFSQYLSVLSALYVAGFHHVYIHTNEEPSGKWWKELAKENVTLVKLESRRSVFQQTIKIVPHISDVMRYQVLDKYGGVYQDFDVIWTSYVPDSLLSNPFVASNDWLTLNTEFPTSFNLGVMLSRPGAQWLHYYLQTYKDFRANSWGYNSLLMSYRTYELYPHLMHVDPKLMVICHYELCHPTWEKSYVRRNPSDRTPTISFNWRDVGSIHTTRPKPQPSMSSLKELKEAKSMNAEIGRFILQKSGRHDLL